MATFTTEIASDQIISDNPIHQRLLKAYYAAQPYVQGNVLEVGCGEGRGVELLLDKADQLTGIDKIQEVIDRLTTKYPQGKFMQSFIPPFGGLASDTYDTVVSFQVIEHIQNDRFFLEEIYRVLKPGGTALISTPNILQSLSRNPWHIREYKAEELRALCTAIFDEVDTKGITGNDKVWQYHEENRASVKRFTRFDILNLQYRLPAWMLRIPYDLLNRMNRNALQKGNGQLVSDITHEDFLVTDSPEKALDLFYILHKK